MSEEFDARNKREWEIAIKDLFPDEIPHSTEFEGMDEIVRALSPFCKVGLNHTLLPKSGGMDIVKVQPGRRYECLELLPSARIAYICKPSRLFFEHLPETPWDSFLLLETHSLAPTGVYEGLSDDYEEVVELKDGSFYERSCWDEAQLGHDEDGNEIPLPEDARLAVRFLAGKFLFVAKRSLWNRNTGTYDGRHSKMTAQQIRHAIETAK